MDKYTLSARVYPAAIVFLPVLALGIAFSVDIKEYYHVLTAIGITSCLAFLFSHLSREFGKEKENGLWKKWGGAPTSQLLRKENNIIDPLTKEKIYSGMKLLLPESAILIENGTAEEMEDVFRAWIRYLRGKTRETKKFQLIFKENVDYGFRRNLWAMKKLALLIDGVAIAACYIYVGVTIGFSDLAHYPSQFYLTLVIDTLLAILWILLINENWVKTQAFAYAERLIESFDSVFESENTK